MGFGKWEGKQEIRFGDGGGKKKFNPEPGKYEVEIQDTIDTVYNEVSGNTSVIIDFRTTAYLGEQGDGSDLGLDVRCWFADGIQIAKDKLSAVIYCAGVSKNFEEVFEDVPNMSDANWADFLKEIKARLPFRKLGVELAKVKGKNREFTNIVAFFAVTPKKKVLVETDDNFQWPAEA